MHLLLRLLPVRRLIAAKTTHILEDDFHRREDVLLPVHVQRPSVYIFCQHRPQPKIDDVKSSCPKNSAESPLNLLGDVIGI